MGTGQMLVVTAVLLSFLLICPGAEGCGWTTTALSGTVQSPNFPSNYSTGQTCVYIITAPADYQITLTFTDFDLEFHNKCLYDYVLIRDGNETSRIIADHYCGLSLPAPLRTFDNQMWIKFVSDGSGTRRGFRATFTSDRQSPFFLTTASIPGSSKGGNILRIDVDTITNHFVPIADPLYTPIAVDYDPTEKTMYWTEVGQQKRIRRSSISGSGVRTILDTGDDSVMDGLAVDPASRLIFYTDTGRDLIAMVTMSTLAHKTIINTNLDEPRAIVLDTADGVMFWTDWGKYPKIERANYDGTDRRTLINTDVIRVNGLALDVRSNCLYWVDGFTGAVEVSDMEGQNRKTLLPLDLTAPYDFFGLAHLNDFLYLTDWNTRGATSERYIHRLDLVSGNITDYAFITEWRLNDIHVYDPRRPSNESANGCGNDNGGCGVICIPLPSNSSKCTCPDGQNLASDQISCEGGSETFSVVVNTTDPLPFETKGDSEMTLTCDLDPAVIVSSYAWNIVCSGQSTSTCVFQPRPAKDEGMRVTCTVTSTDGRVATGALTIQLSYPPQEAPTIHGFSRDKQYQAGHSLTLTCSVHGGKPLVTSVNFFCGTHLDTSPDIFSTAQVHSVLSINPLREEDDGVTCFCTAQWKNPDWYKQATMETLRVTGISTGTTPKTTPKNEANVTAIAAGCSVGVIVIIVIIIVVCVVVRRKCLPHRETTSPKHLSDNQDYCSPKPAFDRPRLVEPPVLPYMINGRFVMDPSPPVRFETDDNEINVHYETLDNVAAAMEGDPSVTYLEPVAEPVSKPRLCSWDNQPSPNNSYIQAVPNPAHQDYVSSKLPKPN